MEFPCALCYTVCTANNLTARKFFYIEFLNKTAVVIGGAMNIRQDDMVCARNENAGKVVLNAPH